MQLVDGYPFTGLYKEILGIPPKFGPLHQRNKSDLSYQ